MTENKEERGMTNEADKYRAEAARATRNARVMTVVVAVLSTVALGVVIAVIWSTR